LRFTHTERLLRLSARNIADAALGSAPSYIGGDQRM
jgi:hypothetical protein